MQDAKEGSKSAQYNKAIFLTKRACQKSNSQLYNFQSVNSVASKSIKGTIS